MKKIFLSIMILVFSCTAVFAYGLGADAAEPKIEEVLKKIKIPQNKLYLCSDKDVELMIDTASSLPINIFELIDCVYQYLSKNNMRVEIKGSSLKKLMESYNYGGNRILALMPIPLIEKIYVGSVFKPEQKALQIFLEQEYEKYIEIGTALYEKEFGFKKLTPRLFSDSYGMKVKKFGIKLKVKKIDLYGPCLGAIYAGNLFRPKKWYLWYISKIRKEETSKDTKEKNKDSQENNNDKKTTGKDNKE